MTALVASATLLVFAAFAQSAFASHSETAFFEAPENLLGVPATYQAKTFNTLRSLGVHALRVTLWWRDVAPKPNQKRRPSFNQSNPRSYHWGEYDLLIDRAVALHWKVLLTVSGPAPDWATPRGDDKFSNPSTGDFRQFMEAVGKRYGKIVKLYSIWNEPNQPGFLRPQYAGRRLVSPAIYRGLFFAGYDGLRSSGNFSGMQVLIGETSAAGLAPGRYPGKFEASPPLAFLSGVICLGSNYRPAGHCG
jgi:hypothetical protein